MKLLLYEPEECSGNSIYHALRREGYDVYWIKDYLEAKSSILHERYDASLINIDDNNQTGLSLIKSWVSHVPNLLCVAIYRDEDTQVGFQAGRLGSQEIYEIERGSINELDRILKQYKILARRPQRYKHKSPEYQKAIQDLANLVNHGKPVLITGEPGTGKSYLAEHVHCNRTNKDFKLEEISCADLNCENELRVFLGTVRNHRMEIKHTRKGLLEKANEKGLLYLKDIHLLPQTIQKALVEIIERGEFRCAGSDVWVRFTANIIASCNDISEINDDKFDRRLYELLSHNVVQLPAIRNCQADIIPNTKQMIEDYCVSKGIVVFPILDSCAIIKISTHDWPGNYRELKSCIENAVICCNDGVIIESDLKITRRDIGNGVPNDERGKLIYYLMRYSGKKILVREAMGISAPTLDKKLKLHGIDYRLYKRRIER